MHVKGPSSAPEESMLTSKSGPSHMQGLTVMLSTSHASPPSHEDLISSRWGNCSNTGGNVPFRSCSSKRQSQDLNPGLSDSRTSPLITLLPPGPLKGGHLWGPTRSTISLCSPPNRPGPGSHYRPSASHSLAWMRSTRQSAGVVSPPGCPGLPASSPPRFVVGLQDLSPGWKVTKWKQTESIPQVVSSPGLGME